LVSHVRIADKIMLYAKTASKRLLLKNSNMVDEIISNIKKEASSIKKLVCEKREPVFILVVY